MTRKTVFIPPDLFKRVTKTVKDRGLWANEAEFIREAIRRRLDELEVLAR